MQFLITAGGTREYIDPVRFISNDSSGKMGYALAQAAKEAGHRVILISASRMQPPVGVDFVGVDGAKEMFEAVKEFFPKCDCLIMAAAVADYTPARPAKTKIKKQNKSLTIKLKPTTDILKWAGKHKRARGQKAENRGRKGQIVVGFALEDKNLRARAEKKLKDKNLDMVVANSPAAIGADKSVVQTKVRGQPWLKPALATKAAIAKRVIRQAEDLFEHIENGQPQPG